MRIYLAGSSSNGEEEYLISRGARRLLSYWDVSGEKGMFRHYIEGGLFGTRPRVSLNRRLRIRR